MRITHRFRWVLAGALLSACGGLEPVALLVRRSTLEDVFLRLTGRTLVD